MSVNQENIVVFITCFLFISGILKYVVVDPLAKAIATLCSTITELKLKVIDISERLIVAETESKTNRDEIKEVKIVKERLIKTESKADSAHYRIDHVVAVVELLVKESKKVDDVNV